MKKEDIMTLQHIRRWFINHKRVWMMGIAIVALFVLRDIWLGMPVLAIAWLASHLGETFHALIMHQAHPGATSPWPVWSWQDFQSWYQPGIPQQWHHIWSDPTLRLQTRNLLVIMVVCMLIIGYACWQQPRAPQIRRAQAPWGAHWATHRELRELVKPPDPPSPISPLTSLYAGRYLGRDRWLPQTLQESMILLVATTGSGKTSRWIVPSLLRERGSRSLYIPDPKSELWRLTSGAVARYHHVWRFAPSHSDQSHSYNPLAYVTDRRSARKFADCFLQNTGETKETDSYWTNLARSFIVGVTMHLMTTEPGAPLVRLVDRFTSCSLDELISMLAGSASKDARDCAKTIGTEITKNPRIEGIVMPDLASRWDQLKTVEIARVTARNDIDFAAMVQESIALYVCVSAGDAQEYSFLTACLMMQMFNVFVTIADAHRGQLPRAMMCYLDEFTNQGYIPQMVTYLSTLRSAHVAMLIAVQSYAQIRQKYGETSLEAIRSICNIHITLPGSGQEECEFFTRRIGEMTITPQSASTGYEAMNRHQQRISYSTGETKRELITADEIRRMSRGSALIVISHLPAFISQVPAYFEQGDQRRLVTLEPPAIPSALLLSEIPPDSSFMKQADQELTGEDTRETLLPDEEMAPVPDED
jgi:type IV secretion system protein VirD4